MSNQTPPSCDESGQKENFPPSLDAIQSEPPPHLLKSNSKNFESFLAYRYANIQLFLIITAVLMFVLVTIIGIGQLLVTGQNSILFCETTIGIGAGFGTIIKNFGLSNENEKRLEE